MTDEELNEIEARAQAATEGPWVPDRYEGDLTARAIRGCCTKKSPHGPGDFSDRYGNEDCTGQWQTEIVTTDCGVYTHNEADIDFIAHARQDVPALVAEVRRLQAALVEARTALGWDE